MRILLSAFACSPLWGSEPGVGWRWAVQLARDHDVTVLTHAYFQSHIEWGLAGRETCGLKFAYHRVSWLRKTFKPSYLNSRLYYLVWQIGAYYVARRLDRVTSFDLTHHLTWGSFRFPSFLGLLRVPFVFGPVGGGESAPARLTRSLPMRERLKEAVRDLVRISGSYDPLVWLCLWKAKLVLCRTEETRRCLPAWARRHARIRHEIGAPPLQPTSGPAVARKTLKLLHAGRLVGWKGAHLALRALAKARDRGVTAHLSIAGDGPMRGYLEQLAFELNLGGACTFHGHLQRDAVMDLYADVDAFLFPSLHDSGGTVVLEALSRGVPVICVDLGGPPNFIDQSCGYVIPARKGTEHEVVEGLANAITGLYLSRDLLKELSKGALARAETMSWERQVQRVYDDISEALAAV